MYYDLWFAGCLEDNLNCGFASTYGSYITADWLLHVVLFVIMQDASYHLSAVLRTVIKFWLQA